MHKDLGGPNVMHYDILYCSICIGRRLWVRLDQGFAHEAWRSLAEQRLEAEDTVLHCMEERRKVIWVGHDKHCEAYAL
jgi:hypothetical protein